MKFLFTLILGTFLWSQEGVGSILDVSDLEFIRGLSRQQQRFGLNAQSVVGIPLFLDALNVSLAGQNADPFTGAVSVTFDPDSIVYADDGVTCATLTFSKLAEGLGGPVSGLPWIYQAPTDAPLSISELERIGAYTVAQWKAARSNNAFTISDSFLTAFTNQINESLTLAEEISVYFNSADLNGTDGDYSVSSLTQASEGLDNAEVNIVMEA